jgi:hypothetical protein
MRPIELVNSINMGRRLKGLIDHTPQSVYRRKDVIFAPYRGNYLQIIEKAWFYWAYFNGISLPVYSLNTAHFNSKAKSKTSCLWSPHQSVHSERLEWVQHNFICYMVRWLPWRVRSLPVYDARCHRSSGALPQENCRQCALCAGNSGWQGQMCGPFSFLLSVA